MRKWPYKLTALALGALIPWTIAYASDYYDATGVPAARSLLNSADLRAEFLSIETGISDKLPALTGNGSKIIAVNSGGTALEALSSGITVGQGGTGAVTLTGLLQGNGTSAFTAITNSSTAGQVLRVTGAATYGWGALDLADGDAITGDLPDANLSANVPLLNAAAVFTGQVVAVSGANPQFRIYETDVSVDNKNWGWYAINETLHYYAYDDALTGTNSYMDINRTGTTIDSIGLFSTALQWNGNTLFSTANDGSGSGLDADLLDGSSSAAFVQVANNLSDVTAATARTNLGLAIGTNVQAYDADLAAIAGLANTDSNFIVGNGSAWVAESGSTARTSLGLGSIATQASSSVSITGGAISGITDLAVADGGTGASDADSARANLDAADLEITQNIQNGNYGIVLTDAGKHIYKTSGAGNTITVPANSSVAFDIGTVITIINDSGGNTVSIAITTDTMILAGTGGTGTRTLADHGVVTIIKVASTTWFISGVGVT